MAMIITDDCINCCACASKCPVDAIYEPSKEIFINGKIYSTVSDLCNNCFGLKVIKCISICPMSAIIKK